MNDIQDKVNEQLKVMQKFIERMGCEWTPYLEEHFRIAYTQEFESFKKLMKEIDDNKKEGEL